jgi:putative transport protein
MEWLTAFLAKYPELGVYLALGIGYWIGTRKIAGFTLGGVTGSLLAGMLIGFLFHVPVSGTAKSVLFLLFLFGIGYEVGPRFVAAMKGDGWRFAVLAVFMPVVGLLVAWPIAHYLQLDAGLAAGMLSGALTESPAMGTANEAIQSLGLDAATTERLVAHVGVADAVCYLIGALGVIFMCKNIGPALLRVDLKAEARKLEEQYGISRGNKELMSAWQPFETRAYRVPDAAPAAGLTVRDAERRSENVRLFVLRIRRGGQVVEATPSTVIAVDDVLAVNGRREALVRLLGGRLEEIEDPELLSIPIATRDVFVSQRTWAAHTLREVFGSDSFAGVFPRSLTRNTMAIPLGTGTVLERGDVLSITGAEPAVERATKELGEVVTPSDVTDFVVFAFAVFLGALLGAVAVVPVGSVRVAIGTSVGTLIAGIVVGHMRLKRPLFGRIPDGAVKFMQAIGLAGFVAMVGIGAGPHFVEAVKTSGIGLLVGGAITTFAPLLAGLWFGHKVLKINPVLLLGAISGAQTFTAGLAALQEESESSVAVIGYSGSVAIAHVVLTTWGTVMVLLMAP